VGRGPETPELLALGEALAQGGDDRALLHIERLRGYFPIEADSLLGLLRLRQNRFADAGLAWEKAFVAFRTSPWAMTRFMVHILATVPELGPRDAAAARRVAGALQKPFAARAVDDARTASLAEMSFRLDARLCPRRASVRRAPHPLDAGVARDEEQLLRCFPGSGRAPGGPRPRRTTSGWSPCRWRSPSAPGSRTEVAALRDRPLHEAVQSLRPLRRPVPAT